jgi:hypothetical protein
MLPFVKPFHSIAAVVADSPLKAGTLVAYLEVHLQEACQAWRLNNPSAAVRQDRRSQRHLVAAEEVDRRLRERGVATGCIVVTACQAGLEVAHQIRLGLVDWVDGEVHRSGNRRELKAVAHSPVLVLEGSCRRVFAARWEVDASHPDLKALWVHQLALRDLLAWLGWRLRRCSSSLGRREHALLGHRGARPCRLS